MPLLLRSEEHTSELQSPCNLVCLFRSDRKSTRLNSSHLVISYAVFCLKKKKRNQQWTVVLGAEAGLRRLALGVRRHTLPLSRTAPAAGAVNPPCGPSSISFFFNDTATTEIYTLSLHDALPIYIYLRRGEIEQPAGLDDLEAFV